MQKRPKMLILAALVTGMLLISACGPAAQKTPTLDPNALITQAAATVAAELTKSAPLTPSPTNTTAPINTVSAPTVAVEQPTQPAAATNTPAPTSASAATLDGASFVDDITVPDGTGAAPGALFDKVWRIKNTGKTTWTVNYALVWVEGDKMGAPDAIPMPKEVRPGETVDITAHLIAPAKPGSYQTFFRLRNEKGQFFRLDSTGDLWIKISVGGASPTPNLTATFLAPTATETPKATTNP